MQILLVLVALICLRLHIALPLATNYDYDLHRDGHFADSENLVHHRHVRHRPSHLRSLHNNRRQELIEMEKSESATELLKQASNEDPEHTAVSSNFQHHVHHQHQLKQQHPKLGLQPEQNNHLRAHYNSHYQQQQHKEDHNSNHIQRTHARLHHHKNVLKSMTTATAASNIETTIDSETSTSTRGLVKPTSHPTVNVAHTITFDEANKSMQNYNRQPLMRQHHKQYRQQHQQLNQNHHKLQLKSDLSETKLTMASVNGFQHNLPAAMSQHIGHNELVHATLRSSGSLHSSSNMHEGIDNNVKVSGPEQSASVGGSTENIAVMTPESSIGLSEAQTNNDRPAEYTDDEAEYYDYTSDDDSNTESRDYQNALASVDVGYDYDSGIDDDHAEWLIHTEKKNDNHQHPRRSQEQTQPHRRQQLHRQKQYELETEQYQSEHFRVARDHHRVPSQQLGHNHLPYDARSDDEYPDDEPYRDSEQFSNRPGDLTFQKYRELGTMQAVQQSRDLYMQRHKSPSDLATEHINRMKVAARCSRPLPRVFHVSNDTSKTYVPSCTILHRCGEDTGCCRSMGQVCTVKTYEDVPLHFIVIQVNSSNSRRQTEIEILWLRNDTECHCINRTDLTSAPEFNTRDKRSGYDFRRRTQSHFHALDSQNQLVNRNDSEENNEYYSDAVCRCPKHFDIFQEDIRLQLAQQRHELQSSGAQTFNCRCDCTDTTTPCQRFKNGEEGFAMDDRRCIADKTCSVPNCSYGIYNEQMGRCPRPSRKHKRHNTGFG